MTEHTSQPVVMKLATPRGEIAYRRYGNPQGKKVLAIHGWLDNGASFFPIAPSLKHLDLVVVDLPGHGDSYHRHFSMNYSFVEWIVDLNDILFSLNWEKPILMGHSLGAGIATIWAGTFPESIEKLVLIESLGPMTDEAHEAPTRLNEFLTQTRRFPQQRRVVYSSLADVIALRRKATPLSESSARLLISHSMTETDAGWVWKSDPRCRFVSSLRLTPEQVLAFIQRITCPTLAIIAEDGLNFNPSERKKREAAWANFEKQVVPGHHHVHMDHPERIAPLIHAFLDKK